MNVVSRLFAPLQGFVDARFLSRLVASDRGRAFLLSFMADAEESDEGHVFDTLIERVTGERLRRLVERHQADEVRHGQMLRAAAARAGADRVTVPDELRVVFLIDAHIGGVAAAFVDGAAGVMEACVFLQVVEERAVLQYPAIVTALDRVDPESARVVADVVADERKHVRYMETVGLAHAADAATHARTLSRYRDAEARAYEEHGKAFLRYALEHDLIDATRLEKMLWGAMASAKISTFRRGDSFVRA